MRVVDSVPRRYQAIAVNVDHRPTAPGFRGLLAAAVVAAVCGCRFMADGNNLQGVREYQAGNYAAALQRFQRAAQADPGNADAIYNMAATYHRQGMQTGNREMLGQAELLYNQALDRDPNHADAYRGLAVLLNETDRPDKSFKLLKNWVAGSPGVADARIELARLYEDFGDLNSAKLHLQEAIQLDQNNARAWRALAHVREREQDYTQALANYQRAYQLRSDPAVAERIATLNRYIASRSTPSNPSGSGTIQARGRGWTERY